MTTDELKVKIVLSKEFSDKEQEEAITLIDNLKESNEKLFKMVLDKILKKEIEWQKKKKKKN